MTKNPFQHKIVILHFLILLLLSLSFSSLALTDNKVREGDLVRLNVKATDLDQDKLTYIYPEPFNKQGEWQTTYGDAGTYSVEIVVTDGKNEVRKHVRLTVEKRNRAPSLKEAKIKAYEGQTIDLKAIVDDVDKDPLTFSFPSPFNHNGLWVTKHGDAGYKVIEFSFSDGEFTITKKVSIEILPTNQPPLFQELFSDKSLVDYNEGDMADFYVQARDPDNEGMSYRWVLDNKTISEKPTANYHFSYDESGAHFLSVSVTDGKATIKHDWELAIHEANRPPEFRSEIMTVKEGDIVKLGLPAKDEDNDNLSYIIPPPFNESGEWQTSYNDAGTRIFVITASDGLHSTKFNTTIIVANTNRAPTLNIPQILDLSEGQTLNWSIETSDQDNDNISLTIQNLPQGAQFDPQNKSFSWQPGYDTLRRSGGMTSNILNSLRLERFFLKEKSFPILLEVCDQEYCVNQTTTLIVHNVNQRPVLNTPEPLTLTETGSTTLTPTAVDNDGDILHYYFTAPLNKKGEWQTEQGDKGIYTTYVTATDGQLQDTIPVNINILKNNRAPTLNVADDDVTVNENQQFQLTFTTSDPDNDNVTVLLKNPPLGSSLKDGVFLWTPNYDTVMNRTDSGLNDVVSSSSYLNKKLNNEQAVVWLSFAAFDAEVETIHPVKVTIKNVNRAPAITQTFPQPILEAQINEPVTFQVIGSDPDNDQLTYKWDFGVGEATVDTTNTVERVYTTTGDKSVKVTITDGRDSIFYEWKVHIIEETNIQKIPPTGDYKVYVITS